MAPPSVPHAEDPATPELRAFVRDQLGCTCPAEVFQQVDDRPSDESAAAGVSRRFAIGGRLLLYLVEAGDATDAVRRLEGWIATGRAERDRSGMQRLRLVVTLAKTAQLQKDAETIKQTFTASPWVDARTHLHVLEPSRVAFSRSGD